MINPLKPDTSIPSDFSSFERMLVKETEIALTDGLELERWSRDPNRKIKLHRLNLNRHYDLHNEAYGYLADVTIGGRTLTAIGALQHNEFGKITGPNPDKKVLKEAVSVVQHPDFIHVVENPRPGYKHIALRTQWPPAVQSRGGQ